MPAILMARGGMSHSVIIAFHSTIFLLLIRFIHLPLLASFIALLMIRTGTAGRKWWNAFGLGISTAYVAFTFFNKVNTDEIVVKNLHDKKIISENYLATPTPLNNFLWYILVKDTSGFYISYHSIFDRNEQLDFHYFPQNKNLLAQYHDEAGVNKLIRFSAGYYSLTAEDSSHTDFHDLRFGQLGGWNNATAPFVFSYHLEHEENNTLVIQRGRINLANKEALQSLIQRIKGN